MQPPTGALAAFSPQEEAEGLVQALGGHKLELQLARGRLVISDMRKRLKQQQMRSLTGKRPSPRAPEDASAGGAAHKPKARRVVSAVIHRKRLRAS